MSALPAIAAPQLSWVLPMYRTAAQLDELLARIHAVSGQLVATHEVILVDDACPDGSGPRAEAAAATDPRVRVLRLPANGGQDAALRAGLRASRGEWTAILDADLQDPPEAFATFWARRDVGPDGIVFAQRTGRYESRARLATSRAYRVVAAWIGGLPPGACLFALLGRDVVDRANTVDGRNLALLALLAANARRCVSVPVLRSPRLAGTSAYTFPARLAKAATSLWQLLGARRLRATPSIQPESP